MADTHKAYVYVDRADQAEQATIAAGVTEVLAIYGVRVLVRATDEQLRALEAASYQIELADHLDQVALLGVVIDTTAYEQAMRRPAPPLSRSARTLQEPVHWLVLFVGPPLPAWTEEVRSTGALIKGSVSTSAILAAMTRVQAEAVSQYSYVQWVGPYEPLFKVHPALFGKASPVSAGQIEELESGGGDRRGPSAPVTLTITLFEPEALSSVVEAVGDAGGRVLQADLDTVICEAPESAIIAIAGLPAVAQIGPYEQDKLLLVRARPVANVQYASDMHGLDGEGEIVAVTDTGLDVGIDDATVHDDFKTLDSQNGRVTGYGLGRPGPPPLWDDPDGHGTHVSGTAIGNGQAGSRLRRPHSGVAYKARLVIQSVYAGVGNSMGGLPANTASLFAPAYDGDGARVHNNSWGTAANPATYSNRAYHVDAFVWNNPDAVILFAAGNEGADRNPGADGVVDFSSLNNRASFRNGICVGASENERPQITEIAVPSAGTTVPARYGSLWAADYPAEPLKSDLLADSTEQMAPFSSRGPTDVASGNRVKPDVVAPGACIYAPKSRRWTTASDVNHDNSVNTWGPYDAGVPYVFMGGTSMATPFVSGTCALIRQYLHRVHGLRDAENADRRRRRPSAALIKALLVHGARAIQGRYRDFPAVDNTGPVPSNHQGWGRIDLRRSLFSHPVGAAATQDVGWLPRRTIFLDDPGLRLDGVATAEHNVQVNVIDNSVPLRATLVWTDYPGAVGHNGSLLNQLELRIIRQSDNHAFTVTAPAGLLPAGLNLLNNNVQQIDVSGANLLPGTYTIRVRANAVPSQAVASEAQDFALVISGPISRSDYRTPGVMHDLPDLAFVDLEDRDGQPRHDGLAPSPDRGPLDAGSPDIWLNREPNSDRARAVQRIEAGQKHYVYVRVHNLGFAAANGARVQLFWADPRTPMSYPGGWRSDGIQVGAAPGNTWTGVVPARGAVDAGPFEWDVPQGYSRLTLFARAEHPEDPVVHEGDVRWDNNITRRDLYLLDNATQVQGEPSGWDKFAFWWTSGAGSPRNIDAFLELAYVDARDGQEKPLPEGLLVEMWDYDTGLRGGDDKLAEAHTFQLQGTGGRLTSAVRMRFSTSAGGERGPDLYVRIVKPAGTEFDEFVRNSYFATGSPYWPSKVQANEDGGFYREDFDGDTVGVDQPVRLVMSLVGKIRIRAALEYYSVVSNEFEKLPAGVPVKIMDSNPAAPQPLLTTATTDDNGEIGAVIQQRTDYQPSIYFQIDRDAGDSTVSLVDYFNDRATWSSRDKQAEIVAADGTVRTRSGHFENWADTTLVGATERLRFRLEAPRIHMHLKFEYFDREATAYRPLPAGIEVEVWKDGAAAVHAEVIGVIGADGRAELSVPKQGDERPTLYARVIMRRRLSTDDPILAPTATVREAGAVLRWETRGQTATDGVTAGLFANVDSQVGTAASPVTFRIGAGVADATTAHAAPFVLRVIGEMHDWLRSRTRGDWRGMLDVNAELFASPTTGSRFDSANNKLFLNTTYTAPGAAQPDHWNRDSIAHQFGHLVLEYLYLYPSRTAPSVANHRGYVAGHIRDRRLAFAEGWADYISSAHRSSPACPDAAHTGWRGQDNDGLNNSGEIVPVAVANVLCEIDTTLVGHGNPSEAIRQRRFLALIWNPVKSLISDEARQVPYHLYRAIQGASLEAQDLIAPHGIAHIRQEVRRIFERNGMVFTRGRVRAAAQQSARNVGANIPEVWRFQVEPADRARLNGHEMGRIQGYRMQAARVGAADFVDLTPLVVVPPASPDQRAQIDVNLTGARQVGPLATAGMHRFRVAAQDEFGAWDTFADDFTGNVDTRPAAVLPRIVDNTSWQRNRLGSIHATDINVPAT